MVTGDIQISTLHVYAEPDPIRVRDYVKITFYRSFTVCVVVLCVLLLTEVIVLCVTFTQERDRLTLKIDNLTKVTDYLVTKSQNLTNERDRLMWEKSELQKNLNTADGWIYYQSSLYFISSENKSWSESRRYCIERGADLIIINNKEEQDFVNKTCKNNFWLGLTDIDVEGIWKWVDGSTVNTEFWWPGEPNDYKGVEDCALSYVQGWNDVPCMDAFQSICEKNIFK